MFLTGCPSDPPSGQGDADNDGVIDANDDCPNTPAGTDVDANGCPVAGDDADGDGVTDANDDCPNTPAGANVDENGCAPSQLDSDNDGVNDDADDCPNTPEDVEADENGCPVSDPGAPDADNDGVGDDVDQCLGTPAGAEVDANGCPDTDGDAVPDNLDQCPDTPADANVDEEGCTIRDPGPDPDPDCGNGEVEGTEQCDDGNNTDGDGCSAACLTETGDLPNDFCANPTDIEDGTGSFTTVGANTDGPDGGSVCNFFGRSQVDSDVWFCYTATCNGEAVASLCGSEYDTKMAVYSGCGCPSTSATPLDCSDDDCGAGVENVQSRVTWQATSGEQYMIRVGGFIGEQGDGRLTIRCGTASVCGGSTNSCSSPSGDGTPGCSDAACCNTVCEIDQFCCDLEWDDFCVDEAEGLCDGQFVTCAAGSGSCGEADGTPGCATVDCCNTVCENDPYCCITDWDDNCVSEAQALCALSCGARAGDCFTAHVGAGCNSIPCCHLVCPEDPFCCDTEWDSTCAAAATSVCDQP